MPIFLRYRIIAPCYYAISTNYAVAKAVAIKSPGAYHPSKGHFYWILKIIFHWRHFYIYLTHYLRYRNGRPLKFFVRQCRICVCIMHIPVVILLNKKYHIKIKDIWIISFDSISHFSLPIVILIEKYLWCYFY